MGINFPPSPAIGTLHPDPAQAGIPQYRWDGTAWMAVAGNNNSILIVSDTPPPNPVHGTMWWDSDLGTLALYYNDGTGAQWVQAVAVPLSDTAPADGKFYARQGNVWVEVPRYQRISLAGGKSFDLQVPTGAVAARLSGVIYPTTNSFITVALQLSLTAGVFKSATSDYSFSGFRHRSITTNTAVDPNHFTAYNGMLIAPSHASDGLAIQFDGTVTLKRPNTACLFQGDFRSFISNTEGITHAFYYGLLQAAAGSELRVLALRLLGTVGDNWAAESYLNVEWM